MPYGVSQLLELTLLSARDLAHVSKSMKTFAVVWINPDRKLETRPDNKGQTNPAWNEKFVFRIDADSLAADASSAVNVELYAMTRRRDDVILVGSVSVLVASLSLTTTTGTPYHNNHHNRKNVMRTNNHRHQSKMRFLTLQIRRPSGRPQGVLEIGVALLDGTRRSMPLSGSEHSSSVAFADSELIEMDDERRNDQNHRHYNKKCPIPSPNSNPNPKPKFNNLRRSKSERSISEVYLLKPAATESDSVISESVGNYAKRRASLSSDVGPSPSVVAEAIAMGMYQTPARGNTNSNSNHRKMIAAVDEAAESSILEDWVEEDDSVEGLKTKIERWRSEIHPLYQKPNESTYENNNNLPNRSTYRKNSSGELAALAATPSSRRELRRGGSGLFSCFGTAYGCEFSITCGGGGRRKGEEEEAPVSISDLHYGDQYV